MPMPLVPHPGVSRTMFGVSYTLGLQRQRAGRLDISHVIFNFGIEESLPMTAPAVGFIRAIDERSSTPNPCD